VRSLLGEQTLDEVLFREAVEALGQPTLAALVWLVGYYVLAVALAAFRPHTAAQSKGHGEGVPG